MPRSCSYFIIIAISSSGGHGRGFLQILYLQSTCDPGHTRRVAEDNWRQENCAQEDRLLTRQPCAGLDRNQSREDRLIEFTNAQPGNQNELRSVYGSKGLSDAASYS